MRIKLLVGSAGVDFAQNPGEEIEVGVAEAARMIAAGQAVEVDAAPPPKPRAQRETAAKHTAKSETATR